MLAKFWWFKKYPQAEIENPNDQEYLGITVGRSWVIDVKEDVESIPTTVSTE